MTPNMIDVRSIPFDALCNIDKAYQEILNFGTRLTENEIENRVVIINEIHARAEIVNEVFDNSLSL